MHTPLPTERLGFVKTNCVHLYGNSHLQCSVNVLETGRTAKADAEEAGVGLLIVTFQGVQTEAHKTNKEGSGKMSKWMFDSNSRTCFYTITKCTLLIVTLFTQCDK